MEKKRPLKSEVTLIVEIARSHATAEAGIATCSFRPFRGSKEGLAGC
ncbi:hypothetical protein [Mesorhizobium sp. M0077]